MREQLVKFLEENYGDLTNFVEHDLRVSECVFVNDAMILKNVIIVGDNECFDNNDFYQYVLDNDKLYIAYFDTRDEDGNILDLDCLDYEHAYMIVDITKDVIELMKEE